MSYSVLVVDDSKVIRSMIRRNMEMSGIQVKTYEAADGAEALKVLAENWIDLVFADVHMDPMNGIELVQHMAQDTVLSAVPVVMVSSDRSAAHMEQLHQLGVRAYIKKPFRPENFRDVVAAVLGHLEGGPDAR